MAMEGKSASGPLQLWNNAVKAVKGESTGQLVEQFTAEMTLVAEGLCEDQARLRRQAEDIRREQDSIRSLIASEQKLADQALREYQRETDRRLDEISRRLAALEHPRKPSGLGLFGTGFMRQATIMVAIAAGAWVLVTILNLFK